MYYGGVDSTPLFVVLAGAYAERTGDRALINELWPALQLAAQWIARHCDKNPWRPARLSARVRTRPREPGLEGQPGLRVPRGRPFPRWPDRARRSAGVRIAGLRDDGAARPPARRERRRDRVRGERAQNIRVASRRCSGWRSRSFYGIALDGHGELCSVLASNAGHLLAFGLPSASAAKRSRGSSNRRSFTPAGACARSRRASRASTRCRITTARSGRTTRRCARAASRATAIAAARCVCCRHCSKRRSASTCACPSCSAAFRGSAANRRSPIRSRACRRRGRRARRSWCWKRVSASRIDAERDEVRIDRPQLPDGIDWLEIGELRVGERSVSITFRRVGGKVIPSVEGDVRVVAVL